MRKISVVLIALVMTAVMVASGCAKKESSKYNVFVAPDKSFSIELPPDLKEMKKESQQLQTNNGPKTMDIYSVYGKEIVYTAAVMKLGVELDVKHALEGGVIGTANGGKVLSQNLDAKVDGYPAAEARIKKNSGGADIFIQSLQVYAGTTQYQVQVMSQKEASLDEKDAKHFIESLKILAAEPAKKSAEKQADPAAK